MVYLPYTSTLPDSIWWRTEFDERDIQVYGKFSPHHLNLKFAFLKPQNYKATGENVLNMSDIAVTCLCG
jgi:hypothetical protein